MIRPCTPLLRRRLNREGAELSFEPLPLARSVGDGANWDKVDALMLKTLAAAEKVARYKHAQLSAVCLAGDISGKMDDVSLGELLVTIKQEWAKLGPLIDLEAAQVPQG
jgi:hypothetical protein